MGANQKGIVEVKVKLIRPSHRPQNVNLKVSSEFMCPFAVRNSERRREGLLWKLIMQKYFPGHAHLADSDRKVFTQMQSSSC